MIWVTEGLASARRCHVTDAGVHGELRRLDATGQFLVALADFAEHLPAHPEQQDAAGQRQTDDLQQLRGGDGKGDAQQHGAGNAEKDHLAADAGVDAGGGHADHDGVVASQNDIDENDLRQRGQLHRDKISG